MYKMTAIKLELLIYQLVDKIGTAIFSIVFEVYQSNESTDNNFPPIWNESKKPTWRKYLYLAMFIIWSQ